MGKAFFYNENCFDSMSRMVAKGYKVDLVLTSPPYNTARTQQNQRAMDNYENRYDIHLDNKTENEYADWTKELFDMFDKIIKPNGIVIYNISYGSENPNCMWLALLKLIQETNFMIADSVVWKKSCALPNNVSPNKLTRICEFVFILCRKTEYKTYNANKKVKSIAHTGQKFYENIFNYIEAPNNDGSCDLNKATYSSSLCCQLLDIYAQPDSIVYDPFMGTGTTAVACKKLPDLNLTAIGSELSEAQVAYSRKRYDETPAERDAVIEKPKKTTRTRKKKEEIVNDATEEPLTIHVKEDNSIEKIEITVNLKDCVKTNDEVKPTDTPEELTKKLSINQHPKEITDGCLFDCDENGNFKYND